MKTYVRTEYNILQIIKETDLQIIKGTGKIFALYNVADPNGDDVIGSYCAVPVALLGVASVTEVTREVNGCRIIKELVLPNEVVGLILDWDTGSYNVCNISDNYLGLYTKEAIEECFSGGGKVEYEVADEQ